MQEDRKIVIIDSDFLSSLLKIGKLFLIKEFFKVDKLYIPVAVFREIAKTGLIKDLLDYKYLIIEKIDERSFGNYDINFQNLGSGEKECIVLCKQFQNSLLLISDKKALSIAKKYEIGVLNIPSFLLACKITEFLDKEDIQNIINDLKEKDYYEFTTDEKKRLMK